MRCPRCGNDNPPENRFCGMCGATVLHAVPPPPQRPQPPQPLPPLTSRQSPQPVRSPQPPPPKPEPVISGPSFLGLNNPAPQKSAKLSGENDDSSSPRNLDYLLEDDEPRRGGWGKFLLIVVALALAVGLGYLRWKNQGFAWLNPVHNKPSTSAQDSSPEANSTAPTPPSNAAPPTTPAPNATSQAPAPTDNSQPSAANPPAAQPTPSTTTAPAATDSNSANPPATASPTPTDSSNPNSPASNTNSPAPDSSANAAPASDTPNATESDSPPPAPKPPKPADVVTESQKYLYGRGVPQDCNRGLKMLRPAASQGNPKALIEMGALYSAGLCTPRDLPTAYRWFSLALKKQPNNQDVTNDLTKLWGEMTQPERQVAMRMTQ